MILKPKVTKLYDLIVNSTKDEIFSEGGAGSGKSYANAQVFLLEKLLKLKEWRGLILRKTWASLRISTYEVFIQILRQYGLLNTVVKWHQSLHKVTYKDNVLFFMGLDKSERIKSTEFHDIWFEEANEFTLEEYNFMKTRKYRGRLEDNYRSTLYVTDNPVISWIQDYKIKNAANIEYIHSTYLDNPFVNEEYKKTLEDLKEQNLALWKIYAKGEVSEIPTLIYEPFKFVDEFPDGCSDVWYGMDFGYSAPTALIKIGLKEGILYLKEELYASKLTNPMKIKLLNKIISDKQKSMIFADSEDPGAITEIANAGFYIIPYKKEKGSVKQGIDFCMRQKIYTTKDSYNINKERSSYCWKTDKDNKALDEPVKHNDHLMDAMRYGIYGYYKKMGLITDIKSSSSSMLSPIYKVCESIKSYTLEDLI